MNRRLQSPRPVTSTSPKSVSFSLASKTVAGILVMIGAAFAVYWPAFHGGFIWDDNALITENWQVKSADGLRAIWLGKDAAAYWPVTSTVLWFEWRMFGMDASGYHCVNVLLHLLNSVVLWRLLRMLKIPGAWL